MHTIAFLVGYNFGFQPITDGWKGIFTIGLLKRILGEKPGLSIAYILYNDLAFGGWSVSYLDIGEKLQSLCVGFVPRVDYSVSILISLL